jgi:hypothetical protein
MAFSTRFSADIIHIFCLADDTPTANRSSGVERKKWIDDQERLSYPDGVET